MRHFALPFFLLTAANGSADALPGLRVAVGDDGSEEPPANLIKLNMQLAEKDATPSPASATTLPLCPAEDPLTHGVPVDVPAAYQHRYVGTYPVIPGVMKLDGFSFVDGSRGVMDAQMNYLIPNATRTLGLPNSAAWCNAQGAQSFRIVFYGMCRVAPRPGDDEDSDLIKVVGMSQLGSDCLGKALPGGCRLVQVSKKGAPENPGTWTEYEGPGVANGGGIEWVHDGTATKMRLKYSLCPDDITGVGVSKVVVATFTD